MEVQGLRVNVPSDGRWNLPVPKVVSSICIAPLYFMKHSVHRVGTNGRAGVLHPTSQWETCQRICGHHESLTRGDQMEAATVDKTREIPFFYWRNRERGQ